MAFEQNESSVSESELSGFSGVLGQCSDISEHSEVRSSEETDLVDCLNIKLCFTLNY